METYTYLYTILTTIVVYYSTSYILRKLRKYPPSPTLCLPIIGHLYLLKEPIPQTFAKIANRYSPVTFLRFGSRPVLLVSSPEAVEECLSKNDVVFCNRMGGFLAGKYLGYNYLSLTWSPYGPHWRNLRKILAVEVLSPQRLQLLAGIRVDEVRTLVRQLYNQGQANEGSVVTMKPLLINTVMNEMTRMIFGKRYYGVEDDVEASKFREVVEGTFELFNVLLTGSQESYI